VNALWWLLGAAAGLALLYRLALSLSTRAILRSYRRTPAAVRREFGFAEPEDLGLEAERVHVEVEPGLTLAGFLFRHSGAPRGVVVYHHGIWDACRPRLGLAALLPPAGFDVVMYDSRGHGESGGRYCTYGFRESADLSRVLDWVGQRGLPVSHVAVVGHSMGAATAVYAAAADSRIRAVVLESCYRDLRTAIRDYARLWFPLIPEFHIRQAEVRAARKAGFDLDALSPLAHMSRLAIPVLIVQGTADRQIKPLYAREHFEATPEPRELYWIEGARHGRVWHEGGERYEQKLRAWLEEHMPVLGAGGTG
jgi:alpha-beta hydrolase superfamily lysophospholipase